MNFIGRESYLEKLEKEYQNKNSFVVIYGRRRVGKTRLIQEFIKDKQALYFSATEEIDAANRDSFSKKAAQFTGNQLFKNIAFQSWEDFFKALIDNNHYEKMVLVIDEFQYLLKDNPAFPSIFKRIWEELLQNENIMVIICGSHISMMLRDTLNYQSPLYGRRTASFQLPPLSFSEIQQALPNSKFEDLVEHYAITGGVPQYMNVLEGEKELQIKIEQNIINKFGYLYYEPSFLIGKIFKDPARYTSILNAISNGNRKQEKIANQLQLNSSSLSPYLTTLQELFLIEKKVPATVKDPSRSRKGLYYVSDNFLSFWFKFVRPYISEIETEFYSNAIENFRNHFIEDHVSYVFEDICIDFVQKNLSFFGLNSARVGQYWDKNTEIDVMAIDRKLNKVLVGECKYINRPVSFSVLKKFIENSNQINDIRDMKKVYCLFSKSGFDKSVLEEAHNRDDIKLVSNLIII